MTPSPKMLTRGKGALVARVEDRILEALRVTYNLITAVHWKPIDQTSTAIIYTLFLVLAPFEC